MSIRVGLRAMGRVLGGGVQCPDDVELAAVISTVYSLCSSLPFGELTASPSSIYTLSLLVAELVASPGIATPYLVTVLNPAVVVAPASAYSLSTAVT